jgi:hypothetical protein
MTGLSGNRARGNCAKRQVLRQERIGTIPPYRQQRTEQEDKNNRDIRWNQHCGCTPNALNSASTRVSSRIPRYNPDLRMRRLISIVLLLVVNTLTITPLLGLSAETTVASCCRRGGKHRCTCCRGGNAHARAENQSGLPAVSSSCPCLLRLASAVHSSVFQTVSPNRLASFTVARRDAVARVTHFVHGADRYSQPKRGPPVFLY